MNRGRGADLAVEATIVELVLANPQTLGHAVHGDDFLLAPSTVVRIPRLVILLTNQLAFNLHEAGVVERLVADGAGETLRVIGLSSGLHKLDSDGSATRGADLEIHGHIVGLAVGPSVHNVEGLRRQVRVAHSAVQAGLVVHLLPSVNTSLIVDRPHAQNTDSIANIKNQNY